MTVLEFIFSVLALIVGAFVILGIVVSVTNTRTLEQENEKLKMEIQKLRSRKLKSEYKGVKNVK